MKKIFTILVLLLNYTYGISQNNYPKQYQIPETGGSPQWIKLGTYTAVQLGESIKITIIGHIGYNAANNQDFQSNIFFKTSNGVSVDVNGFAGNSQYYSTGPAAGGFYEAKWVSNAVGIAATSYDLYVKIGAFTRGSTYTVENSFGSWTHLGELKGTNDPGNPSGTVCSATEQLVLGSNTYFSKSQYLQASQFFYNRLNVNSSKVFGMANDDDKLKIWSYEGPNSPWNERFTLLTNGNIGIGNTNPSFKLDVSGSTRLNGEIYLATNTWHRSTDSQARLYFAANSTTYFGSTNGYIWRSSTDTDLMTLNNNGNLGIGIINPQSKLHINVPSQNGATTSALRLSTSGSAFGNSGTSIDFYNQDNGAANLGAKIASLLRDGGANAQKTDLAFYTTLSGTNSEKMRITSGGTIGIGTDTPGSFLKLDILGRQRITITDASNTALQLENAQTEITQILYRTKTGGNDWYAGNESGHFTWYNGDYRMRIMNNGNVGIGTTNPQSKLQVTGDNSIISITPNQEGQNRAINFMASTTVNAKYASIELNSTSGNLQLRAGSAGSGLGFSTSFFTDNVERMRINSTGQVLIGTTTSYSDYKLAVAGNVIADKIKVKKSTNGTWPDFVFDPTYKLPTLTEVESFVKQNRHLPEIPSASEIEKDGQDLGEMNRLLLKKVEELTLYLIEEKKRSDNLQKRVEILEHTQIHK